MAKVKIATGLVELIFFQSYHLYYIIEFVAVECYNVFKAQLKIEKGVDANGI